MPQQEIVKDTGYEDKITAYYVTKISPGTASRLVIDHYSHYAFIRSTSLFDIPIRIDMAVMLSAKCRFQPAR